MELGRGSNPLHGSHQTLIIMGKEQSKEKTQLAGVIDMTPSWKSLLQPMLEIIASPKSPSDQVQLISEEFYKMATAADAYVDICKKGFGIITDEQRFNLLVGAIEGGSNYWYWLPDDAAEIWRKYKHLQEKALKAANQDYDISSNTIVGMIWAAIKNGAKIRVVERDDKKTELGYITYEGMINAERLMIEQNHRGTLADIIGEQDDAGTADIWLQLTVMGGVVYG